MNRAASRSISIDNSAFRTAVETVLGVSEGLTTLISRNRKRGLFWGAGQPHAPKRHSILVWFHGFREP
jgi:hypothetical protein